jgi:hypothetical protein
MLGAIWWVLTLPFRIIGWVIEMFGRLVAVAIGFVLMVVGVALCAASLLPLGIPTFLIGLILALKSL